MDAQQLKQIMIYAKATNINIYLPLLNKWMHHYKICGKKKEAAFLATITHESGSLNYVRELASGQAYEGRKDLGNTQKGDGVRFKGRGLIQITGRHNYTAVAKALNIDCVNKPELLEQPEWAVASACWWWGARGLNEIAETGDFMRVTKIVNGGYNGMADRQKWYDLAMKVL